MADDSFLKPGTRTTFCGRSGSGKSTVAVTLLGRSRQKWVLIDPKKDDKIATLNPARVKMDVREVKRAWDAGYQFAAITPGNLTDPMEIDAFLHECFDTFVNFGVYIDELYFIHNKGSAGPGLTSILTRGRSDKITYFGATQRPAWISIFCLSEVNHIGQFHLNMEKDRKRIYEITGRKVMLNNPDVSYGWYYYDIDRDKLKIFVPPSKGDN